MGSRGLLSTMLDTTNGAFVETLRECFLRGYGLVPNNPRYWHPDWCCFRIVPLSDEAASRLPPRLRLASLSLRAARMALDAAPLESVTVGEGFAEFLRTAYPGEDLPSLLMPRKACAELREIPNFTNFATSLSY